MATNESRAPRGPGFFLSWLGAGIALAVAGVVLWSLASPKKIYDSWWESQRPARSVKASHEELALYHDNVYRVRAVRTTVRGDSLFVHPRITGSLRGSYTYRAELAIGFSNFAVDVEERQVVLPDELPSLDFTFALSELDSAFAAGRGDSLNYQVRYRLDPNYLYDPKMRSAAAAASHDTGSSAFLAATYFGR